MTAVGSRVILVTGAGRGIGAACARAFAAEGARVVLVSRSRAQLETVAAEIDAEGCGRALVAPADVGEPAAIDRVFERVDATWGPVDVLVNCAATLGLGRVETLTVDDFDRVMAVNVRGVFLCCQRAFARMRGRGGAIVNISSLGGVRSTEKFPRMLAYTASKAAVIGLTESLAVDGRSHGIRVNCLAPGAVDTAMLRDAAPHLKTVTTPDDIASMVLFLADPRRSGRLSGSVLEVFSNA